MIFSPLNMAAIFSARLAWRARSSNRDMVSSVMQFFE